MKRFSEQLHTKSKTVKLRVDEKRELRERLVAYMEYHPLPTAMKATPASHQKANRTPAFLTEAFTTVSIPFSLIFKSSAVAAVLLVVIVPFVAERAVPGDTLYAVKVQFNEELRSTLTFDSYQKVEWETQRLNRRIAEARLLASEGKLTEEVEAEVAQAVKTHTENAQKEIDQLRLDDADGATIASIALDTTLEVQSNSLRGIEAEDGVLSGGEGRQTDLIASVIDQSRSMSGAKNASSTLPSYAKLMARVEQNTTRVYELRDVVVERANADQIVDVNRRIEDIERAIMEALEEKEGDEFAARTELVTVLQRTQRLIVFMTELQVATEVDIETIVPVVLTEAEMKTAMDRSITLLEQELLYIEGSRSYVTDEDVLEKVQAGQAGVAEYLEELKAVQAYEQFMELAEDAFELAADTRRLLSEFVPNNQVPIDIREGLVDNQASSTATTTQPEIVDTQEGATSTEPVGEFPEPL